MRTRGAVLLIPTVAVAAAGAMSLGGISAGGKHPATARNRTRDVSSRLPSVAARQMISPRHVPPAASPAPVCAGIGSEVKVAAGVTSLASGDGAIWVSGFGQVSRLDPATGRLIAAIRAPGSDEYSRLAVGEGSVWVTSTGRGVVYRIDPSTDRVAATIHLGGPAQGIAVGGGRVWVALVLPGPGRLIAIDPRTNRASGPPITVGPGPGQVVYGQHAVWVQNTSPASVMRINPETGRVTTVIGTAPLSPGSPGREAIAVGCGSLWSVANGALTRLAPGGGRTIARVAIPRAVGIALGEGQLWVLSYPRSSSPTLFEPIKHTAAVWAIDPHTNRIVGQPIRLHALQPIAITSTHHGLWVADFPRTLTRVRLVSCHAHSRPARPRRHDAALPHRFGDRADGVAVRYPAGWRVDRRPLTRLILPRQLLVVSSFPIRQRRPDPNCAPTTAITELPPTGVLLFLLGRPSNSSRSTGHHPLPTPRFHLEDLAAQPYECFGTSREIDFRSAGQELYLLVCFGPRASRHTERLADQTMDSLVLHAPTSPERHGWADATYGGW